MGNRSFMRNTFKQSGIVLSVLAVIIAGTACRVEAQSQVELISGGIARPGTQTGQPQFVPPLVDATPLFEEAHRRLAELKRAGGVSAVVRAPIEEDAYVVGDRKKFWAINFAAGTGFPYTQYEVEAECRVVGEYAYYFVEVAELPMVQDEHVEELVTAFEENTPGSPRGSGKGIYEHVTEVFGDIPDVDGDQKIVILLTDIPEATAGSSFFAGYFYGVNQSLEDPVDFGGGVKQRSNNTEMLYVNSRYVSFIDPDPIIQRDFRNFVKSTTAHEFQHLIQYSNDELEITAVNEGFSEYASFICGYGLREIANYVSRTNVDLFSWRKYGSTLRDYSRVALWTYYLGYRLGDDFIKAYAADPLHGLTGLNSALNSTSSPSFEEIFNDFLTTLYLRGDQSGDVRFDTGSFVPWVEPQVHENLHPSAHKVTLEPYGAIVLRYWNASDMTVSLPDGLPSGVTAQIALKSNATYQVSDLTASGTTLSGLGTTYEEAGLIFTNGSDTRSMTFKVTATATQGDEGMVKYENGRPFIRYALGENWQPALRITPEVAPARLTGIWLFFLGNAAASVAVRTMVENTSLPGTYFVNESPIFSAIVEPSFNPEGWLYVPVTSVTNYTQPGVDYLVSMRASTNATGYTNLTRGAGRSFINQSEGQGWELLAGFGVGEPPVPLDGNWMIRAEFAYQDITPPQVSLGLLQHPLFPTQADVYVMGNEPLHPGTSSGTIVSTGSSTVDLLFERTLGSYSIVDPTPVVLDAGQISLSVEAFDRYGGLSDTATLPVSVSRIGAGNPASLSVAVRRGAVSIDISAGEHSGTVLTLIPYDNAPEGLPGAPGGGYSVLEAPVVSLAPAGWIGPAGGSELRVPVRITAGNSEEFRFERWEEGDWIPVPGGVSISSGEASGPVPGGGWYRLARGTAPALLNSTGGIELLGNAPNPFNPQTTIRFRISSAASGQHVKLIVLNTRGQQVKVLIDRTMGAGEHIVTWSGDNDAGYSVSSGIYLYRLETGSTILTSKMLLLR